MNKNLQTELNYLLDTINYERKKYHKILNSDKFDNEVQNYRLTNLTTIINYLNKHPNLKTLIKQWITNDKEFNKCVIDQYRREIYTLGPHAKPLTRNGLENIIKKHIKK